VFSVLIEGRDGVKLVTTRCLTEALIRVCESTDNGRNSSCKARILAGDNDGGKVVFDSTDSLDNLLLQALRR